MLIAGRAQEEHTRECVCRVFVLKSKVASVRCAEPRFTESIRFAKSSSRTTALLPDRKIARLAIASGRSSRRESRSIDSVPPLPPSPCFSIPRLVSRHYNRGGEFFMEKSVSPRLPFVIYSCALVTRSTSEVPLERIARGGDADEGKWSETGEVQR